MRPVSTLLALSLCLPAADNPLPVSSVTLFSSGVGYVEHAGQVQGEATMELRFRAAQINDVLKSLVLQDLDGGRIGTVGYPSQDPLDKTLKSFQVDVSGNPALAQLLNQLRGAAVQVEVLDARLDGVVLGCESRVRTLPQNGGSETRWVLNLLVDGAIRPVELDAVRSLKPTDAALQAELAKALAAVAGARDQDKKPVALRFSGQGPRRVRVGYVAEAPVWKASYRLILATEGKPYLQGWAIVENPTETDWNDVRLTLVSGRPISFIQDLYQPLYAQRPVVATELQAGLRPVAYAGGQDKRREQADGEQAKGRSAERRKSMPAAAPMVQASAMAADALAEMAPEAPRDWAGSVQVASQGTVDQGELFQYTVGTVTIPRQRSAMIPFIGGPISAERVAIYNRGVQTRHPLAGARLMNSTGNQLSAGPVTVYDDAGYLGDAQLTALPKGQTRLISFAVDQQVAVDSEQARDDQRRTLAKIVQGVAEIQVVHLASRTYAVSHQGERDRTLVIEHPRRGGWSLADTPAPRETTDALYRFDLPVAAGKDAKLTVTERFVSHEALALVDGDLDAIRFWIEGGEVKPAVKQALVQARSLIEAWRAAERAREEGQTAQKAIADDQERIRRNIGTVDRGSDYAKRLLAKLNEQETRLEQLRQADDKLAADILAKRQAVAEFVAKLTVE